MGLCGSKEHPSSSKNILVSLITSIPQVELLNIQFSHCLLCLSIQVRLKLVKDWLPVLVVSRESASSANQNKQLHLELEDVFLRIILTLPMADAQKLLQQCLSFATRNVEDCPHLVTAFNIWFKRASQGTTMAQGSTEPEQGR